MRFAAICLGCLLVLGSPQPVQSQESAEGDAQAIAKKIKGMKQLASELDAQIETLEQQLKTLKRAARPADQRRKLVVTAYNVSDLVSPAESAGDCSPGLEDLHLSIETRIAPHDWEALGGRGTIAPLQDRLILVVSQTPDVHEDLREWLKNVREAKLALVELLEPAAYPGEPGK